MKLKVFHKHKRIYISVDEFTVSQIEKLLKLEKTYEAIKADYDKKLKHYNDSLENYVKKVEPLSKLKEQIGSEHIKIRDKMYRDYEVNWSWLTFDKFEYTYYNPFFDNSYSKSMLKSGARSIIPRVDELALEYKKIKDTEVEIHKKMVPPKPEEPKTPTATFKLINRWVTIYPGQNTNEEVLRALEFKNKKQTISAKAAAYDGTQRQLANSIKIDIRRQIHAMSICPYCGKALAINDAHADHIYPVSKGGLSTARNMVYICAECNLKKRDMTLRNFVKKHNMNSDYIHQNLDLLGKDF